MTKIRGDKVLQYITEEDVQSRAEESLDRRLTQDELDQVSDLILGKIDGVVHEALSEMTEMDELISRNMSVETLPSHYLLYWKNKNRFQKEYKAVFAALTEEDIREYILRTRQAFDQYKIVFVHEEKEKVLKKIDSNDLEVGDF